MYDGKRVIPAPFVSIVKTYTKSGNGDIIGKIYNITVNGTLIAYMGSPDSDGDLWTAGGYPADEVVGPDARLAAIQRKQEALRDLFSTEGKAFEIQSANGAQSVRCYPRINSIDFSEGLWYNKSEYSISLECDELYPEQEDTFSEYIESASEEWNIDTQEEPQSLGGSVTYGLSHSISAVGKKFFDETSTQPKEAWQYARDFVLDRLGFDSLIASSSGVNNLPDYYNGWNHRRSEQVDEQGGSFSVTENWLMASGSATEDFSISTDTSLDSPHNKVSINGSVTGFEARDADMQLTQTKWDNAQTKFAEASGLAFLRAQTYTGQSLNVTPLSWTIGRNPFQGTIDYTFEYDARPMTLIEDAISETISINDNIGGELFASIFVLGRANGPVLQDLNTKPANTRNLSIEIVVTPPTYSDRTTATMQDLLIAQNPSNNPSYSGSLQTLVDAADPTNNGFSTVFQDQPQENWEFQTGRYSYNCTWTYE